LNVEVRRVFMDGERAARAGDRAIARTCFIDAARAAIDVQLWRSAMRCYRHALELDLLDLEILELIRALPIRVTSGRGWDEYRAQVSAHAAWPHLNCRSAQILIGEHAVVSCEPFGTVLELMMTERDLVEVRPDARLVGMPSAMALVVLRRAMWPSPREHGEVASLRVAFDGRQQVRLDEHGDWDPVVGR
jgi:hypothetical protein